MRLDQGQALHDRSTRGEKLSDAEQQLLDAWYVTQDQAESNLLFQHIETTDTAVLRTQLDAAIKQLALVSQRIDQVMLTNDELHRSIAHLQTQLAPQFVGRAA